MSELVLAFYKWWNVEKKEEDGFWVSDEDGKEIFIENDNIENIKNLEDL